MKNLKNLGESLSKKQQKLIRGGNGEGSSNCSGPTPAEIAQGFPASCSATDAFLSPGCNGVQQSLADSGCSYWKCVCGKESGVKEDFPFKVKGYI